MDRPERRFYFLLAAQLGCTVEELLARISATELAEWQAYYRFEPFGEPWKQTSYVCSMIGNAAGGKKCGGRFRPDEFLPIKTPLRRAARQSSAEMLSIFKTLAKKQTEPCQRLPL